MMRKQFFFLATLLNSKPYAPLAKAKSQSVVLFPEKKNFVNKFSFDVKLEYLQFKGPKKMQ